MSATGNGRVLILFVLSPLLKRRAKCIFWLLLASQSLMFFILSDAIEVFSFRVVLFDSFGFFVALFDPSSFFALLFGSFNIFSTLFYSSRFFASFFN